MTASEAIDIIKHPAAYTMPEREEADKMAISALEKQIPKKVLPDNYEGHMGKKCSMCGKQVWLHQKYCENCCQRLKWEDEE